MASQKWFKLSALIPSVAMVFVDQSILPVALPTIQRELGAGNVALQWCVNAYLLTTAVFCLIAGKVSDRIGHRRAFMGGILLFALSSAFCGLSPTVEFLIGARLFQGVGAALIFPSQAALTAHLFEPHERGRASGINVSLGSLFLIAGPLIGGYLTEDVSWRWIFWINLPIAAIGIFLTLWLIPSLPPGKGKIDLWGFLYFALACTGTVLFFMQGEMWGWNSWPSWTSLFLAICSLILLLRREKMSPHPFLDLALFKSPLFAAINLSVFITSFILMIGVFRAVYFQTTLEYTPSQAGLISSVTGIPILFLAPLGGYLADKVSAKLPVALGFLCLICSFFWLAFDSTPTLIYLLIPLMIFGIGIPFIFTPSYSSAMSSLPPKKLGVGLAMITTLRMIAATMGIALIGAYILGVQNRHLDEGSRNAEIASFSSVHFALGFLLIVAFAIVFILYRPSKTHKPPETPAEGYD